MSTTEFSNRSQELMALLPSLYRIADATPTTEDGYLHTLAGIVGEQLEELRDDLRQLYDDLFIETCAPWVVPYIGELVGVLPARDIGEGFTTRAQVANVIGLRRRKGTADVVEELAESITGWAARVVEMFAHIAATQHLNHQRPTTTTVSLRSARELELIDTAFDPFMHTVDVGWIRSRQGRYRPQNLAVFLWPEISLPFRAADAVSVDAQRYRFHPLGIDTVLVTQRRSDTEVNKPASLEEVPWPISRRILDHSLETAEGTSGLYGPNASILVTTAEGPVPRSAIVACALDDDGSGGWHHAGDIQNDEVAVDPETGRILLGADRSGPVQVSFAQSFTGAVGGGYPHEVPFPLGDESHVIVQRGATAPGHSTISAAVAAVGGSGRILIDDSTTYDETITIQIDADSEYTVASNTTEFPTITGSGITVDCGSGSELVLDGLLVSGPLLVRGAPRRITIGNCTFVPGHTLGPDKTPQRPNEPSIILGTDETPTSPVLRIDNSIVGPILVPRACTVRVSDSIIEGGVEVASEPSERRIAVSADLSNLPALGSAPNEIQVLVSGHDPVIVDIGEPTSVGDVVSAIDAAGPVPDIAAGERGNRVIVGANDDLSIRAVAGDDTAELLGFDAGAARFVVRGRPIELPMVFDHTQPRLGVRIGAAPMTELSLATAPTTVDEAAAELQAALRAVGDGPAFDEATVFALGQRLVVVPGAPDIHVSFTTVDSDATAAGVLGLTSGAWAIASDGAGRTGPTVQLERVTVLGRVRATEIELVDDSILAGPLIADRGQTGCVRFSYIPAGSVTPRRYRCIPSHECSPQLAITSDRYGDFRYGELVPTESMIPLRYGSSVGAEMGAFASFQHREREQSLTFNLDEFMRFSMEAGLLDGRTPPGG